MQRSGSPSARSLSGTQYTSWKNIFSCGIQEDDPVWKEYIEVATAFDTRMVDEWTKTIDVVLVFIALFIAVLTSFVIETSKQLERDPVEIANDLLVALYNKPTNGSSVPDINIHQFLRQDSTEHSKAIRLNILLYTSLALSVAISMLAMTAKLWLIRYMSRVNRPGSPYYRAMQRQEAYGGVKAWKLTTVIDALPLLVLLAVFFFGLFVHASVRQEHSVLGRIVAIIFEAGLTFLFVASFSASFISSSPFKSSFSEFIAFVADKIFTKNPRWRPYIVLGASTGVAVATIFLVIRQSGTFQSLIFFPIAGVFAVARKPERSNNYSPRLGLPLFVSIGGLTVFLMVVVASVFHHTSVAFYAAVSSVGFVFLGIEGYCMNQLTRFVPNTLEAEAIAWLLESSPSQRSSLFKNAGQIANTAQRKALLLDGLLPLLPSLITSRLQQPPDGLEHSDLEVYVACLAHLSDFRDTKGSFLKNTATVGHPPLPLALLGQLHGLRKSAHPRLRDAAEAVWRHYGESEDDDGEKNTGSTDVAETNRRQNIGGVESGKNYTGTDVAETIWRQYGGAESENNDVV